MICFLVPATIHYTLNYPGGLDLPTDATFYIDYGDGTRSEPADLPNADFVQVYRNGFLFRDYFFLLERGVQLFSVLLCRYFEKKTKMFPVLRRS